MKVFEKLTNILALTLVSVMLASCGGNLNEEEQVAANPQMPADVIAQNYTQDPSPFRGPVIDGIYKGFGREILEASQQYTPGQIQRQERIWFYKLEFLTQDGQNVDPKSFPGVPVGNYNVKFSLINNDDRSQSYEFLGTLWVRPRPHTGALSGKLFNLQEGTGIVSEVAFDEAPGLGPNGPMLTVIHLVGQKELKLHGGSILVTDYTRNTRHVINF